MRRSIPIIAFVMVLFLVLPCYGEEKESRPTQLYLNSQQCWLREFGVPVKNKAISIRGEYNKLTGVCLVIITDEEFNKRFSYCVNSGFALWGAANDSSYGCSTHIIGGDLWFSAGMSVDKYEGVEPNIICDFMCFE